MKKNHTTALIVAAGASTRMGGTVNKLLLPVDGVPVLARTFLAYQSAATVNDILLVCRKSDRDDFLALAREYHITKLRRIRLGGATRQESVLNGIEDMFSETEYVAIADGARCLILPEDIDRVNLMARETDAASAGSPAVDTIKIVNENEQTVSSPDRSRVWMAATPQTFRFELYHAAAVYAKEKEFAVTDDNSLLEFVGHPVTMVDCGRENLKITSPMDIPIAEAILHHRKGGKV